MEDFLYTVGILAVLCCIILCYEKWKKAGPIEGRGLTGIAQSYHLKISFLTQSLPDETRRFLLKKAYEKITEYQKAYSPQHDIEFLHILFNDKYKDTVRVECFAISFILCDQYRCYPDDDLGRKMAIAYYDDLKIQLANLYDYCYLNGKYFPLKIVDCFCSDGRRILETYSEYYEEN